MAWSSSTRVLTASFSYPQSEHPDHSQPFVMWPDTPYAHLMIPVH